MSAVCYYYMIVATAEIVVEDVTGRLRCSAKTNHTPLLKASARGSTQLPFAVVHSTGMAPYSVPFTRSPDDVRPSGSK